MRSRTFGKKLVPAVFAAASITVMTVPAVAEEAPPPAQETYTEGDCVRAYDVLAHFNLLPDQPDTARVLCAIQAAKQEDQYINEIHTTHTTGSGETVEETTLLGIPVEWPKSLTVHVPTIDNLLYTFTPGRH